MKWAFSTGGWVESSPALGMDGTAYVGSFDGKLYAINPNGTMKWSFTTGASVWSSPAIGADGTIYVGSDDFKFYAILRLEIGTAREPRRLEFIATECGFWTSTETSNLTTA